VETAGEPAAQDAPASKARKQSNLPDFPWTADKNKLVWDLITEMEKPDNSKVLFGKKEKGEVRDYQTTTRHHLIFFGCIEH
jgi:hypothetical protein